MLIDELNGLQLNLNVNQFSYRISSEITQCQVVLAEMKNLASICLKYGNLKLTQIIKLSDNALYVLLRDDAMLCTHVYKINPQYDLRADIEILEDFDDVEMMIAWGSTLNKFFIVLNSKSKIVTGTAFKGSHINRGNEFLSFSTEIRFIKCLNYMEKARKIIFLNQSGNIYSMDTVSKDCIPLLLYKPHATSDPRLSVTPELPRVKEPLASQDGSPFIDLQISEDEKMYALKSSRFIECYDLNNTIIHSIPIQPNIKFKLFQHDVHTFIVINCQNNLVVWGFTPSQERTSKKSTRPNEDIIAGGNPIIDLWHLGIKKFGKFTEITKLGENENNFATCFLDEQERPFISKYVESLESLSKNINFLKISSIKDPRVLQQPISREIFFKFIAIKNSNPFSFNSAWEFNSLTKWHK